MRDLTFIQSKLNELICAIKSNTPSSSSQDWELYDIEWVDVNGANLTEFTELWKIDELGVRTLIATLDETGLPYTITGVKTLKKNVGTVTTTKQGQITLNGGTWNPTLLMTDYSYTVIKVNSTSNPPTFKDSINIVNDLYEGESASYQLISGTDSFDITNVEIEANAGDIIKIYYTSI
jgi:hypothetical protein